MTFGTIMAYVVMSVVLIVALMVIAYFVLWSISIDNDRTEPDISTREMWEQIKREQQMESGDSEYPSIQVDP